MRADRRVVLTRTPEDNAALRQALGEVPALVVDYPCIAIEPLPLPADVRARLAAGEYDAVIFVSRHAAEAVAAPNVPAPRHVVAIGASTERVIRDRGWKVTARPSQPRSEAAARELDALIPGVSRVLYAKGDLGDDVIPTAARERGLQLDEVTVYRTVSALREPLPPFDGRTLVLFASPSAAQMFQAKNSRSAALEGLAIGLTTQRACLAAGLPTHLAPESTTAGLARCTIAWLAR